MVTTDAGCSDSYSQKVTIIEQLIIPNVFTPDGDGVNDYFEIKRLGTFTKVNLKIYNRWGNLIWYTNNPDEHWDGKEIDNGKEAPSGTYFYVYSAVTATNADLKSSGSVTIYR